MDRPNSAIEMSRMPGAAYRISQSNLNKLLKYIDFMEANWKPRQKINCSKCMDTGLKTVSEYDEEYGVIKLMKVPCDCFQPGRCCE